VFVLIFFEGPFFSLLVFSYVATKVLVVSYSLSLSGNKACWWGESLKFLCFTS